MSKTKIIKTANYIIKILIIIISFGFIAYRMLYKHNISELYESLTIIISDSRSFVLIIIVFVLMLLNWSLESIKWQLLIRKIENVSFIKSFMAVWAGMTSGIFTPNRIGEYFGRSFILEKANRWEGVFITFTGSLSQLLVTLTMGTISAFFFVGSINKLSYEYNLLLLYGSMATTVIVTLLTGLFYFRISWVKRFVQKLIPGKYARFSSHFDVLSKYKIKELINVLILSFIRYVVFSFQFYILFRLCKVNLPLVDGLMLISIIYLIMTAIPTFALTELGVRGSVSILLLDIYFNNINQNTSYLSAGIMLAAFLIWFINLIIPSIIGGIFVFRLKFFRS